MESEILATWATQVDKNNCLWRLGILIPVYFMPRGADNLIGPPFEILSDKAVKYYEKLKDKGENVYIDSLTYEQFMMLGDAELSRRFSMQDEAKQKAKIDREQANELEYVDESQKSDAAESANTSNGSAGAKPVRNPEREKPKMGGYHHKSNAALVIYTGAERGSEESSCCRRSQSNDSYLLLSGGYCGEDEFISEEAVNVIA